MKQFKEYKARLSQIKSDKYKNILITPIINILDKEKIKLTEEQLQEIELFF